MELLKGIAAFIGRLTGSLAGIAAIFYACGYLVVRAHFHMLGLFGLFDFPKERYLQEGGKFFAVVAGTVIGDLLPLMVLNLHLLTGLLILSGLFIALCLYFKWRPLPDRCRKWASSINVLFKENSRLCSLCLLICFSYVLVLIALDYYNEFYSVLGISNLLYHYPEIHSATPDVHRIERWLLEGDVLQLQRFFLHLLKGEWLALALLAAAWHVTAVWERFRVWSIFPFLLIAILYTLFVPMAYGVLVRPTQYPLVSFHWKAEAIPAGPDYYSLLNKTDREVVVWDEVSRRVFCITSDAYRSMEVRGMMRLFRNTDREQ